MGIKTLLAKTALARYVRAIKATPREILLNRHLIFTCLFYASAAVPHTWDQGSFALMPNLGGFQQQFNIKSGSDAAAIRNFVTFVYFGCIPGALLCFFVNDKIGRLWSCRLWMTIWIVGQMIGIAAPNVGTMYASRVFSGVGLGALSVTGTLAIVEVAPAEIRGLLASWYSVMMSVSLACAQFCCYGVYLHLPASLLQYRIVMFAPCLYLACWIAASFFLCESPRWLYLVDRPEHAVAVLAKLRGLNTSNPRVQKELEDISNVVREETELYGPNTGLAGLKALFKELFTVKENLRRGSIVLIMYALPILSGANSITSYLVPILDLIGNSQTTQHDMFVSSMYSTSKIFYTLIASFLVIDALGRRKSVFVGATIQFITHIYIGSYIKVSQEQNVSKSASEAALAAIFLHGFGYSIGLLVLQYIFGSELWPNRIRAFGSSLTAAFHWAFHYAMSYAVPSLLDATDNWGAFIFFAAWCAIAILYVWAFVPEIAGLSVEEIGELFRGPWMMAFRRNRNYSGPASLIGHQGPEDEDDGVRAAKAKQVEVIQKEHV